MSAQLQCVVPVSLSDGMPASDLEDRREGELYLLGPLKIQNGLPGTGELVIGMAGCARKGPVGTEMVSAISQG